MPNASNGADIDDDDIFFSRKEGDLTSVVIKEAVIREPDRYFHLPIADAFSNARNGIQLPEVLSSNIGKVRKGIDWEALGLDPYGRETWYSNGEIARSIGGSFRLNDRIWGFTPIDLEWPGDRRTYARAIKTMMRCITTKEDPYILQLLGIPYDEVVSIPNQYLEYAAALIAIDKNDYHRAIEHVEIAATLNPKDLDYKRIISKAKIALGDISVIFEGIAYYKNDMDSAAHCGDAERWLRLAMDIKNDYRLALNIVTSVLDGIEKLISGEIPKKDRIYGSQKKSFYEYGKTKFIKRLGTLRGFLSKELISQNTDRFDTIRALVDQIELIDPTRSKKIHPLRLLLR